MRNLRTQYSKENGKKRSSKVSGAGSGDVYVSSWKWFTSLEFLRDSISPVKTRPTPGVPSINLDENDENIEPAVQNATVNSPPDLAGGKTGGDNEAYADEEVVVTGETLNKVSKQFTKKKTQENLENELLNKSLVLLKNITSRQRTPAAATDSDDLFGQLVAQSLKGIENKRCKEIAKLKIQQLLFEAQFGGGISDHGIQYGFQPSQFMEACNTPYFQ